MRTRRREVEIKALYTVKEAAEMSGMTMQRVRELIRAGQIDAEKIGRIYYIPISSLQTRSSVWESILMVDSLGSRPHKK